jgi:hypothetical protein
MGVKERPDPRSDVGRRPRTPALELIRVGRSRADRLAGIAGVREEGKPTADATAELKRIASAADEDPIVRAAAIAALASNGLGVELEDDPPPAVASAARKAHTMAAARAHVEAVERGEPVARGEAIAAHPAATRLRVHGVGLAIQPRELPVRELRRVAEVSRLPAAAVGHVLGLRCGDNEFAIVVRADVKPEQLVKAPGRPARIAVHHTDEQDIWTVPYDVLTFPEGEGRLRISVIDERGGQRFVGTATVQASGVAFEIDAVRRPGATGAAVRGHFTDGRIVIEGARAATRGVPARRPKRLEGGSFDGPVRQRGR